MSELKLRPPKKAGTFGAAARSAGIQRSEVRRAVTPTVTQCVCSVSFSSSEDNPVMYALGESSPEMSESGQTTSGSWWKNPLSHVAGELQEHEGQVILVLALIIGALTGLPGVVFILLTERLGMRLYPVGSAPWRRLLFPVAGSLSIGYLLFRYFPDARGSGVPQTKAALFARGGRITLRTVVGKFFCTSATLASGIPLGREGPSVQVG